MDALCATQGDRLVVVLGGVDDARKAAERGGRPLRRGSGRGRTGRRGPEPGLRVGRGPPCPAHRSAAGWPDAPRPVRSDDLLPERALAGDGHARRQLVDDLYLPLLRARGTLIETLSAYFDHGGSVEGTGRALFVHPNTVRYRLRQVGELTGLHALRATSRVHTRDRARPGSAESTAGTERHSSL